MIHCINHFSRFTQFLAFSQVKFRPAGCGILDMVPRPVSGLLRLNGIRTFTNVAQIEKHSLQCVFRADGFVTILYFPKGGNDYIDLLPFSQVSLHFIHSLVLTKFHKSISFFSFLSKK